MAGEPGAHFAQGRHMDSTFLKALAQARTMAGLSNLRNGLRHTYPLRVEEAALALLAGAGLGLALMDVLQPGLMETVRVINQAG